jgi:hypothetical protein
MRTPNPTTAFGRVRRRIAQGERVTPAEYVAALDADDEQDQTARAVRAEQQRRRVELLDELVAEIDPLVDRIVATVAEIHRLADKVNDVDVPELHRIVATTVTSLIHHGGMTPSRAVLEAQVAAGCDLSVLDGRGAIRLRVPDGFALEVEANRRNRAGIETP